MIHCNNDIKKYCTANYQYILCIVVLIVNKYYNIHCDVTKFKNKYLFEHIIIKSNITYHIKISNYFWYEFDDT